MGTLAYFSLSTFSAMFRPSKVAKSVPLKSMAAIQPSAVAKPASVHGCEHSLHASTVPRQPFGDAGVGSCDSLPRHTFLQPRQNLAEVPCRRMSVSAAMTRFG